MWVRCGGGLEQFYILKIILHFKHMYLQNIWKYLKVANKEKTSIMSTSPFWSDVCLSINIFVVLTS
jgi:hypothetical protein